MSKLMYLKYIAIAILILGTIYAILIAAYIIGIVLAVLFVSYCIKIYCEPEDSDVYEEYKGI